MLVVPFSNFYQPFLTIILKFQDFGLYQFQFETISSATSSIIQVAYQE